MKALFQNHLTALGVKTEDASEYVGLRVNWKEEGVTLSASNPNERWLQMVNQDSRVKPLNRLRMQRAMSSAPRGRQSGMVKGQFIKCIDLSNTVEGAIASMRVLTQEMLSLGYEPVIKSVWLQLAREYPKLCLADELPDYSC